MHLSTFEIKELGKGCRSNASQKVGTRSAGEWDGQFDRFFQPVPISQNLSSTRTLKTNR